jgi:hypothetical protein
MLPEELVRILLLGKIDCILRLEDIVFLWVHDILVKGHEM